MVGAMAGLVWALGQGAVHAFLEATFHTDVMWIVTQWVFMPVFFVLGKITDAMQGATGSYVPTVIVYFLAFAALGGVYGLFAWVLFGLWGKLKR